MTDQPMTLVAEERRPRGCAVIVAAGAALRPTVTELQRSAIGLFGRMIALGRHCITCGEGV